MTASLHRSIASLAFPAMAAVAADPLYEICDAAVLNRLGAQVFAGAAIAVRILSFGFSAFIFLTFATTAAVARHRAASDATSADRLVSSAFALALLIGVCSTVATLIWGTSWIRLLSQDPGVNANAWSYLRVAAAGFPAYTVTLVGVGAERGLHNTRLVLRTAVIAVAVNLAAELILILGFGWGIAASAGTTAAVRTATALWYVSRHLKRSHWARPSAAALRELSSTGLALTTRTLVLLAMIAVAARVVAAGGAEVLGAHASAWIMWSFLSVAYEGTEVAATVLVSEHRGALTPVHTWSRLRRTLIGWSFGLGITGALVLLTGRGLIAAGFGGSLDQRQLTAHALLWVAAQQGICAVAFMTDGMLVALGRTRFMALAMVVAGVAMAAANHWSASQGISPLDRAWIGLTAMMGVRVLLGLLGTAGPATLLRPGRAFR